MDQSATLGSEATLLFRALECTLQARADPGCLGTLLGTSYLDLLVSQRSPNLGEVSHQSIDQATVLCLEAVHRTLPLARPGSGRQDGSLGS